MRDRDDLKLYQELGAEFLLSHSFGALWLDMGLGKTIIALTALIELLAWGIARRTLIVAPLRVASSTWPNEFAAWTHTADTPWTLLRPSGDDPEIKDARTVAREAARGLGLAREAVIRIVERAATRAEERVRERLLLTPTPVHIINREMVPWLVKKWGRRWPYDTLIFDESSGLRDYKTQRVSSLIHVRKRLERFWQLTATPAPESYIDLFPQVYLLDKGERFGDSLTAFRTKYFDYNKYAFSYTLKDGCADAIIDKLSDLALVMKARDYLPVNDPVSVERLIDLDEDELTTYQALEEDFVASLPSGHEIVAETAGALHQKLLQYASGAVYDQDGGVHAVHDHKIDALQDIIAESQGAPIIVAYWFRPSLVRLRKAFPQGRAMDKAGKLEAEWTKGKLPLMFIHPQSGGHGLNLQYGGHYLVFFDTPYSSELHDQTIGRIARQGQKDVPLVFYLSVRHTLDQGIVPILRAKGDVQAYLFSRLQRLRKQKTEDHGLDERR